MAYSTRSVSEVKRVPLKVIYRFNWIINALNLARSPVNSVGASNLRFLSSSPTSAAGARSWVDARPELFETDIVFNKHIRRYSEFDA